jgi:hypothetical protein
VPSKPVKIDLQSQIITVREMLAGAHYFAEAQLLAIAASSPDNYWTTDARETLRHAGSVARQFGYPAVEQWIEAFLEAGDV